MHSLQFVKEAYDKEGIIDPSTFVPVDIPFAIEENMRTGMVRPRGDRRLLRLHCVHSSCRM